jgi:hypothetical protein
MFVGFGSDSGIEAVSYSKIEKEGKEPFSSYLFSGKTALKQVG